jgi:hypothetical protein
MAQPKPAQPEGRAASLVPLSATALIPKVLSAVLKFDAERRAFEVSVRSEIAAPPTAAGPIDAQLALPEYACDVDSELDDDCDPVRSAFSRVEIIAGDRTLTPKKTRAKSTLVAREPQPTNLWVFALQVAPGASSVLEQRYAVPAGESGEGGVSVSFLMRGTSLWGKPFGRATFEFVVPARTCSTTAPQGLALKSRRVVRKDGELWLEQAYEAFAFTPAHDVTFEFEPCVVARDTPLEGCSASSELSRRFFPLEEGEEGEPIDDAALQKALTPLPDAELERCRDAVFAAYAKTYSQADLQKLPAHPESARSYTAPLLTAADWEWVHTLDKLLVKRAGERKVAPAAPVAPVAPRGGCGCGVPGSGSGSGSGCWVLFALAVLRLRSR